MGNRETRRVLKATHVACVSNPKKSLLDLLIF
jgi:hypothetical protein